MQALSNLDGTSNPVYVAILIEAGYSGLAACRDLALSGAKVVLLEVRDRIGGRASTASIDGRLYEIGGT